jgi:hypothetical protein
MENDTDNSVRKIRDALQHLVEVGQVLRWEQDGEDWHMWERTGAKRTLSQGSVPHYLFHFHNKEV